MGSTSQLETADVFSGAIKFPSDFSASGNEQVVLRASSTYFLSLDSYTHYIYPQAGSTSWTYTLGVPEGTTNWKLEMICNECNGDIKSENHYPTKATGNPMTLTEGALFIFPGNNNYSNMQMSFISNPTASKIPIAPIMLLLN